MAVIWQAQSPTDCTMMFDVALSVPATAPKFGIRGIPTLLLFKDGQVQAQKVGALSKAQLKEFLDTNL